jgi:hypothetical protein
MPRRFFHSSILAQSSSAREELREFLFVNPVMFWTANNPNFFKGTAVEHDARKVAMH